MNRGTLTLVIIAVILIAVGVVIFVCAMSSSDWKISSLNNAAIVVCSFEVSDKFDNISIDTDIDDIEFVKGDACRVECTEYENYTHTVKVENNTLVIKPKDSKKWYDYIGVSFGNTSMTVYLPRDKYESLDIKSNTGDICIPNTFSFGNVSIDGDTCKVDCSSSVSNTLDIKVDTGDIRVSSCVSGELKLLTKTGKISLTSSQIMNGADVEAKTGGIDIDGVTCKSLNVCNDTGLIALSNTTANGVLEVKNGTGSIRFEKCDGGEIYAKTSTGSITGSFLSEKIIFASSSTGKVDVPKSTSGGKCELTTSTGSIKIEMASR